MQRSGYIPSIDGLRALAVLAVIAFHLSSGYLPGGFVGVDIFFVISGFVVAKSVVDAKPRHFLSYLGWFYRRRILRIMPALLTFLVITAAATALFVPTAATTRFIEPTGLAAIFGLSNVMLFLKAGDYFATGSEFNPFTHTWSLAVEEQYYVLFPIFSYLLLVKAGVPPRVKQAMLALLVGAVLVSLAAAAWFSRSNPSFAFYMLPTRFWELGLGFFTFYAFRNGLSATVGNRLAGMAVATSVAAVALLAVALWTTDALAFPFPGALLPCLCTAILLLVFWWGGDTYVSKVFAWKPIAAIGKISYSLYLWHWAVLVLMRWTVGLDTVALQVAALLVMFALAALSYFIVEQPIRLSGMVRRLGPLSLGSSIVAILALVVAINTGLWLAKPSISQSVTRDAAIWDPMAAHAGLPCGVTRTKTGFAGGEVVVFTPTTCGAVRPTIYAVGDSHAGAYEHSLRRLASEGRVVRLYTLGGCRLVAYVQDIVPGCPVFRRAAVQEIAGRVKSGEVVFAPGLYTPRFRDAWGSPSKSINRAIDTDRVYAEAIEPIVKAGAYVVLEAPKPLSPTSAYRCFDWFNRGSAYCRPGLGVSRRTIEAAREPAYEALRAIDANSAQVTIWDPLPILCGPVTCSGAFDGRPVFYDTDHLSAAGNDMLYPALRSVLVR